LRVRKGVSADALDSDDLKDLDEDRKDQQEAMAEAGLADGEATEEDDGFTSSIFGSGSGTGGNSENSYRTQRKREVRAS
jgi:hypothetical protein